MSTASTPPSAEGAAGSSRSTQPPRKIASSKRVDNATYAYVVYVSLSKQAGQKLMPISASVGYRLP